MASNKDMRRVDLGEFTCELIRFFSNPIWLTWNDTAAIPYVDPPKSTSDADMSSTRPHPTLQANSRGLRKYKKDKMF